MSANPYKFLTQRERYCIGERLKGTPVRQIARALGLSVSRTFQIEQHARQKIGLKATEPESLADPKTAKETIMAFLHWLTRRGVTLYTGHPDGGCVDLSPKDHDRLCTRFILRGQRLQKKLQVEQLDEEEE